MFLNKIITLNIENTDVRCMVVNGKRVQQWSTIALEPDLVKEGLIIDPTAVGQVIKQLMVDQGIKEKDIITSLSGFQSVQRIPDLPKLSSQLMEDALMREAKRTMPVSLDQLYLSWQTLRDGDQTQQIFLLGIPRNLMDASVICLREAGINPRTMELKPLALARMVNRPEALIIDVEEENADIIVISGGMPTIMRTLSLRLDHSLSRRLQYLIEEFERTLQFYTSSHPEEPLSRTTPLFLTGGLANDVEVIQVISTGVDYKIETLTSPLECPDDFPIAQYAVNIGMALKNTTLTGDTIIPNVNILPDTYRPHRMPARQMLLVPGVVAGIALIFPLYQLASSATAEVTHIQHEYQNASEQLEFRKLNNNKITQYEVDIAQLESKQANLTNMLLELGAERLEIYNNLHLVAVEALPTGATLSSYSFSSNRIQLSGQALSYTQALDYARTLTATDRFSTVWINSMNSGDDEVNYSITLEETQ